MTRSQALAICFGLAVYLGCASTSRPASAEGAYRAFKRIGGAIAVGVEKPQYDQLLRDASAELLIFRDLAMDGSDSAIARSYGLALEKYKDAGLLWAAQISSPIYPSTIETVASRYHLPELMEHTTETRFRSLATEGIQLIWQQAATDVRAADSVFLAQRSRP